MTVPTTKKRKPDLHISLKRAPNALSSSLEDVRFNVDRASLGCACPWKGCTSHLPSHTHNFPNDLPELNTLTSWKGYESNLDCPFAGCSHREPHSHEYVFKQQEQLNAYRKSLILECADRVLLLSQLKSYKSEEQKQAEMRAAKRHPENHAAWSQDDRDSGKAFDLELKGISETSSEICFTKELLDTQAHVWGVPLSPHPGTAVSEEASEGKKTVAITHLREEIFGAAEDLKCEDYNSPLPLISASSEELQMRLRGGGNAESPPPPERAPQEDSTKPKEGVAKRVSNFLQNRRALPDPEPQFKPAQTFRGRPMRSGVQAPSGCLPTNWRKHPDEASAKLAYIDSMLTMWKIEKMARGMMREELGARRILIRRFLVRLDGF